MNATAKHIRLCHVLSSFSSTVMLSVEHKTPKFVNAIATVLSGDGKNPCPSVLFTHNPQFDLEAVKRAEKTKGRNQKSNVTKAKETLKKLKEALVKYNVAAKRVVYVTPPTKTTKLIAESPALWQHVIGLYKSNTLFTKSTVVLSDAGNAYKLKKTQKSAAEDVFTKAGVGTRVWYPPVGHHFLSPNDNKAHGAAKAKWRASRNHSDDLHSSLSLLQHLDELKSEDITGWFEHNLMYNSHDKDDDVLVKAVTSLVVGKSRKFEEYHDESLEAYYDMFPDEKGAAVEPPKKKPKKAKVAPRHAPRR